MTEKTSAKNQRKKSIREISPIDVYKNLPRTNCGECGEANCMAFATRVVNGEKVLADCPPLSSDENREALARLSATTSAIAMNGQPSRAMIGGV